MAWFACATRRPISVNHGGALSSNLGLVLHHQVGNGSLYGFFNNPSSKVSTHFWVSKGGAIEQYVDSAIRCWGGMNLNASYVQVEMEGCGPSPHAEPMTDAMLNALARIYREGNQKHGWPNANANANGQRGLGFHRMSGSGASTSCPCDVRLNRRGDILRIAFGSAPPSSGTAPPATGGGKAPAMPADSQPWFGQAARSRSSGVRTWQQQMRNRGWTIGVDGAFGPESERVCRAFQSEKRLTSDGMVGANTWNATWSSPVT